MKGRWILSQVAVSVAVFAVGSVFLYRSIGNPWHRVYETTDVSVVKILAVFLAEGMVNVGSGTGFIVELGGKRFILTNRHVVTGADGAMVQLREDAEPLEAAVVDASQVHDLALLTVDGANLNRYRVLASGSSSRLRIGEEVMTIGHPLRESHHISVGFYTGKFTDETGRTLLRLSMAVDPGNSGGPLLNRRGEVVGVLTQKDEESANIAFAIPIEKAADLRTPH